MKVLVIGKNGQLGKSICEAVNVNSKNYHYDDFVFIGRSELDLSSQYSIDNYFDNNKFDIIINCAAYTAVNKAEEKYKLANQINHLAVGQLAKVTKNQRAKLVHISTDYVFDGESDQPYIETDKTNPINVYGETKLAGEKILKETMPTNAIIIRVSWLYSEFGNNFVDTMLKLGKDQQEINVVSDQMGSPTYATDLANAILKVIQNSAFKKIEQETQVYHYSNKGGISWCDFAKEIFKIAGTECRVRPVSAQQYSTFINRPENTVMNKDKIVKTFGVEIFDWKKSLQTCVTNIGVKQ